MLSKARRGEFITRCRSGWSQRDGIENGKQACTAIPGEGLDQAIGHLLIDTLTPLTVEAAFTVQAELEHRAIRRRPG